MNEKERSQRSMWGWADMNDSGNPIMTKRKKKGFLNQQDDRI